METPTSQPPEHHPVRAFCRLVVAGVAVVALTVSVTIGAVGIESQKATAAATVSPVTASQGAVGEVATQQVSQAQAAMVPTRIAKHKKHVWTRGWQRQIDACKGAVDVTKRYGVAVIAEHWRCGGSRFPGKGSIIKLTGVRSGTYKVGKVVAVLNINKHGTKDIPRGYGLLYQTCINGSNAKMAFTVLTRVGG